MKKNKRLYKHMRVRKSIKRELNLPRLAVFRSNQHIYAQLIDDNANKTLVFASDSELKGSKTEKARQVGEVIAKKALGVKVSAVVFDRGGFLYHGRVKALAEGAREGGLKF